MPAGSSLIAGYLHRAVRAEPMKMRRNLKIEHVVAGAVARLTLTLLSSFYLGGSRSTAEAWRARNRHRVARSGL